jgi:hypothetical protein
VLDCVDDAVIDFEELMFISEKPKPKKEVKEKSELRKFYDKVTAEMGEDNPDLKNVKLKIWNLVRIGENPFGWTLDKIKNFDKRCNTKSEEEQLKKKEFYKRIDQECGDDQEKAKKAKHKARFLMRTGVDPYDWDVEKIVKYSRNPVALTGEAKKEAERFRNKKHRVKKRGLPVDKMSREQIKEHNLYDNENRIFNMKKMNEESVKRKVLENRRSENRIIKNKELYYVRNEENINQQSGFKTYLLNNAIINQKTKSV